MSVSASSKHSYSVILPVFNEEETIPVLYKRLHAVFKDFTESYELLFINDGSSDGSARLLSELHKKDKRVKLINFSRNFGHQMAVTAGLQYASGSIMIILDADLQDPPEVLPQFIAKIKEGYDVVYAIRTKRKESWVKRLAYYAFYRLLARVSSIDIPLD
ncbi:MAG: glycosyltransferase family 2 protein, partial [Candidatus Roizmanbacteria bacterium]|nr:glycosyltransferase family 2 protein [Candidatus Roizmanbacteria bacterium]